MDKSILLRTELAEPEIDKEIQELIKEAINPTKSIVVYNDDYNTFDHVAKCLMIYCEHSQEQAEQCTMIIHYKGKYAVKSGSYEKLEPMCTGLLDNGISAEIQ